MNKSTLVRQPELSGFILPAQSMLQRKYAGGDNSAADSGYLGRTMGNQGGQSHVLSGIEQVLRSPGRPLDAGTRNFMEPRFGHDFSQVRVHNNAPAADSARALNASAYTVGNHVVFAKGLYDVDSTQSRKLMAHELTHVIQQGGLQTHSALAINRPGDVFEQEADAVANRVITGGNAHASLISARPMIQRQTPESEAEKKTPEKKEASEVLTEGLGVVKDQLVDNNPQVKKVIIDPIKQRLKSQWESLATGEKIGLVGFGAGTLGMLGGAMLSDPSGRKHLEDVNLATPFTLIPYMPLSNFKYKLPSGNTPDQRLFKFETGFKADDLINLHTEAKGLPKMSLGINIQWGYDPSTEHLTVLGGDASLGIVPGLSLSAGAYKDVIRPPQTFMSSEGRVAEVKKSIPEFSKPTPIPDVRIMLTVDLMKFKPGDLVKQLRGLF